MIREFKKEDEDAIISIWLQASEEAHGFIDASYWREKVEEMRSIYLPSSKTFVYRDPQTLELRGFISLIENYIAAVFVRPDRQGKGIGKQLLDFAKDLYENLDLRVYSENLRSVRFYKNQGFEPLSEEIDENTGHPETVMRYTSNR